MDKCVCVCINVCVCACVCMFVLVKHKGTVRRMSLNGVTSREPREGEETIFNEML